MSLLNCVSFIMFDNLVMCALVLCALIMCALVMCVLVMCASTSYT